MRQSTCSSFGNDSKCQLVLATPATEKKETVTIDGPSLMLFS